MSTKSGSSHLKQYLPDYTKGGRNVYSTTKDNLMVAVQRAEALATKFTAYTDPEPFTDMVKLVKTLKNLKG